MTGLLIGLGVLIEIGTIKISNKISNNWLDNLLMTLHGSGYKIKKGKEKELLKKMEDILEVSIPKSLLLFLLHILPGINILSEITIAEMCKNKVLNNTEIRKYITPMTREENEQYDTLNNDYEKKGYINYLMEKEDDDKTKIVLINGIPTIVNLSVTPILNERLLPLAYTEEEIKLLNKVTNEKYELGKINGTNTAIVGYPKEGEKINKVSFKDDNFNKSYIFEPLKEEEKDTFIVYPYEYNNELKERYDKVIEEISKRREEKKEINKISDDILYKYMNTNNEIDKPKQLIK